MKLVISVNRKVGQPNFGSEGATCGLELDVDQSTLDRPELLAERIRAVYAIAERAVEDQLQRATEPAAPSPPPRKEDPMRPGDPAYHRMHPALPEPARRSPPPQSDHAAGEDLPTNGKQFCGWLAKQSEQTRNQVKRLTAAWRLRPLYKTWGDDDVAAVVRELTGPQSAPAAGSNGHASANGYHH